MAGRRKLAGRTCAAIAALLTAGAAGAQSPHVRVPASLGTDFPAASDFYPSYPVESGPASESGVIHVRVCVGTDGRLTETPAIVRSTSRLQRMDDAALSLAKAGDGRYVPAMEDGSPVASCLVFQVMFVPPPGVTPPAFAVRRLAPGFGPGFPSSNDFYPQESRAAREQGDVDVRGCVGVDGRLAGPPTIAKTSGTPRLDEAALSWARAADGRYSPAMEDASPVVSCFVFQASFAPVPPPVAPEPAPPHQTAVIPPGMGPGFPSSSDFYPQESAAAHEQGRVRVRACVGIDGRLSGAPAIAQTSSVPRLDEAALVLAMAADGRYRPQTEDGVPVPSCFVFGVSFVLPATAAPPSSEAPSSALQPHRPAVTAANAGPGFPSVGAFYPKASVAAHEEGAVVIHACVGIDGRLTEAPTIARTSGVPRLDEAALRLAKAGDGRYRPQTEDGVPVPACFVFRVNFVLRQPSPNP
jgi:TonB family protein